MSYEGYVQALCTNGHYNEYPETYGSDDVSCYFCQAPTGWQNSVDETNCEAAGKIDFEELSRQFLVTPERVQTCDLGYRHVVQPAVFRIPSEKETSALRR